ncbi:MAG: hypothetical protein WC061_07305 [Melioribacteraceae bacterium]
MTEKEFTQLWIDKIRKGLKTFPDDFVTVSECEVISLPEKLLFMPPPFFNTYQITDETGETFISTDDHFKAKYILYGNRSKPGQLKIPARDLHIYEAVRDYEKHLDSFLKEMEKEFKQNFPSSKGFKRISIQVFNSLNLTRQ